ncbi:MAG: GGDEF domain-containing protein, partial [Salaquimonas sp.]
ATLGLLILDLDHFKNVNDNYGHDVGDMVLKEVALRMRAICREHDVVARLGGEEFALITPYAGMDQLLGVAERYREMVEALAIKTGNVVIRPTVSIGVATNENGTDNVDDLFKAADRKLYQAKNSGRNRVAA